MRISDWSSDVCSSDLVDFDYATRATLRIAPDELPAVLTISGDFLKARDDGTMTALVAVNPSGFLATLYPGIDPSDYLQTKGRFHESYGEPHTGDPRIDTPMNYNRAKGVRSEEHTSELQSLMRISYAICC